jgi:ATP synthase protein I
MSGDPEPPRRDQDRRERSAAARFAGVGFQFAVTILLCLWLGSWLDRKFGTAPIFLYGAVFLGAAAAFYSMYRQLMANLERDEAATRARKGAADGASPGSPSPKPPKPGDES